MPVLQLYEGLDRTDVAISPSEPFIVHGIGQQNVLEFEEFSVFHEPGVANVGLADNGSLAIQQLRHIRDLPGVRPAVEDFRAIVLEFHVEQDVLACNIHDFVAAGIAEQEVKAKSLITERGIDTAVPRGDSIAQFGLIGRGRKAGEGAQGPVILAVRLIDFTNRAGGEAYLYQTSVSFIEHGVAITRIYACRTVTIEDMDRVTDADQIIVAIVKLRSGN